jgi:hypothetical protein
MEYKGIRYTIRAGIEREHWFVAIHPGGVEMAGKAIAGSRDRAESEAHFMVDRWLKAQPGRNRRPTSGYEQR